MAKADNGMLMLLQEMLNGGLVNNPELAASISELIIANAFGDEELARQQPLVVTDHGDRWSIKGSLNRDRSIEGPGPISIWMRKNDAAIIDLDRPTLIGLPPDFHMQPE